MKTYTINLHCGDETCYDFEAEKRCEFFGTSGFGRRYACMLFLDDRGLPTELWEHGGSIQRCKECLENVK